jgi:hypothetical protein
MADQLDINRLRAFDTAGDPVSGAKAYFFATGTTTPLTVYADDALSVAHPTPLVADSGGVFAAVYYGAATAAKVRVDDAADATLYTIDPVRRVTGDATGASSITFAPTTSIPEDNVQSAIERVDANASVNFEVITKAAGYTVVAADKTKLIRCTNALTLALTEAATLGDGYTFYAKSVGGVAVTIDPAGSEAINGASTVVVNGWARVFCDGANWHTTPVAEVLDEDDMASDDPLSIPTQQSTKAYIDSRIVLATAQASTSGTSIDFTGIPAGAKRITVMFSGVSLSGSASYLFQLGDAGGFETTGYVSVSSSIPTGTTTSTSETTGFRLTANGAAVNQTGQMIITRVDGNAFVQSGAFAHTTAQQNTSSGGKTLSAELTQIRITTTNGTDTFDAGSINILYEL